MANNSARSTVTVQDTSHGSANSTLNPFEADSVDSLHLTQFSPSVFAKSVATPASTKKSMFRWSIDHLAILLPADIDEHAVQQESTLDSDTEEKAQLAIEQFFSQQHVVPSPWSVKRPIKHVTFSPNPPTISEAEDGISIVEAPPYSSIENENGSKQQERSEVSCQTAVTLPVDFDLQAVLGDRFIFGDSEAETANELCTSSLRRKLFSQGEASPTISPVAGGLCQQPSPERILDIPSPQISPIRQVHDTTLSASDISHVKTPESLQSQFSSSPISSKLTPRRWTPYSQGSRSSSGLIGSPSFSPISSTIYPTTSDSCYPRSDSSGLDKAPPCGMVMPDASPILADPSESGTGMISPFLASLEPSSVDVFAMSFLVSESQSESGTNADPNVASKDERSFPSLPPASKRSVISDSADRSDSDDSGDSQSSGLHGASVCSMEQSYIKQNSESSEDLDLDRQSSRQSSIKDEEMQNGREDSLSVSSDMLSFHVDDSASVSCPASHKQLTSTLRVPSHAPLDSLFDHLPLSSKTIPDISHAVRPKSDLADSIFDAKSAVIMETTEASCRSKFTGRELARQMQSDSGFNTQSFTSMEATDSEGQMDVMTTHEYSIGNCPMADKESVCRWRVIRH